METAAATLIEAGLKPIESIETQDGAGSADGTQANAVMRSLSDLVRFDAKTPAGFDYPPARICNRRAHCEGEVHFAEYARTRSFSDGRVKDIHFGLLSTR